MNKELFRKHMISIGWKEVTNRPSLLVLNSDIGCEKRCQLRPKSYRIERLLITGHWVRVTGGRYSAFEKDTQDD